MFVIVELWLLQFLLFVALAAFGGLGLLTILLFKAPSQVRQLIGIWLHKQVLDIAATDHHSFKFIGWKAREEGQLERKEKGMLQNKMIPRGNPVAADIFHLDGTGIPTVLSYEGKTIATSPDALLAMKSAGIEKKDALPEEIKKLLEEKGLKIKELKIEKTEDKQEKRSIIENFVNFLTLNPLQLKAYCADWFDMNQFTHMREESYMDGKMAGMGMRKPMGMKLPLVGIGIAVVVIAIILVFLGVLKI